MNMAIQDAIIDRYTNDSSENMGCANLWPWLDLVPGAWWCDLGCGRGGFTAELARRIGEEGRVMGVDMTPALIEFAKENHQADNLEWVVADVTSVPVGPHFFDGVTSNCVINHILDKTDVYSEIYRILKSGGVFVVADVMSIEALPEHVRNDPEAIAACWGGAITRREYVSIVENAGFYNVEVVSSRQYTKNGFMLESIVLKGVKI
jgi:ubiquinone/menaquinone biosynthesis C-methylase UbiE